MGRRDRRTNVIAGFSPRSLLHGAHKGSNAIPGIAAATLIQKKSGHPVIWAREPARPTSTSRPSASRLDKSAYCVAEKRWSHKLVRKATRAVLARPQQTSSTVTVTIVIRD